MTDVAVVGAAGYAGAEAVRWTLAHPVFRLACVTSAADAGRPLSELYPGFAGATDLVFSEPDVDAIAQQASVAFLAVPHTAALELVPRLHARGVTVLDMSADFRLTDAAVYEQWYGVSHSAPELLADAVYGLPELDRTRLPGARLVACPGCYPTATTLAALPALEAGVTTGSRVIVDAKSGVSGAGRSLSATTHYVAVTESIKAYQAGTHRHTPEMEQSLSGIAGRDLSVMFVPHLVPMSRGLLSTVYLDLADPMTTAEAVALYQARFADEPFIHVHDVGVMPSTGEVRGTNRAHIGVAVDQRTATLVATCAIDNLGKGSASQAMQCANAIFGHAETLGLERPGAIV